MTGVGGHDVGSFTEHSGHYCGPLKSHKPQRSHCSLIAHCSQDRVLLSRKVEQTINITSLPLIDLETADLMYWYFVSHVFVLV